MAPGSDIQQQRRRWLVVGLVAVVILACLWLLTRGWGPESEGDVTRAGETPSDISELEKPDSRPPLDDPDQRAIEPVTQGIDPNKTCLVSGLVIDQQGEPVAGAWIEMLILMMPVTGSGADWRPSWQEGEERSDREGKFAFELDGQCPVGIAAATEDGRRGECRTSNRVDNAECMLVLKPTWSLTGVVEDAQGVGIEGVRVSATPTWNLQQWLVFVDPESAEEEYDPGRGDFYGMWSQYDHTDDRGEFAVDAVARDDWTVMAEKKGFQRTFGEIQSADLKKGMSLRMVMPASSCWTVRVVNETGQPVVDAEVLVLPVIGHSHLGIDEGISDESGEMKVCEVASNNAEAHVKPVHHTENGAINRGSDPMLIPVSPAGSLVGTLVAPTESGIPGVAIIICRVSASDCLGQDGTPCEFHAGVKGISGPFRIGNVPTGEMELSINCSLDQEAAIVRHVVVRPGEETDIGDLVFE